MAKQKDYREVLTTPFETGIKNFTSVAKYFLYYSPCIDSAQSQGFVLYTTTSSGERSISSIGYKFSSVKDLLSKVGW